MLIAATAVQNGDGVAAPPVHTDLLPVGEAQLTEGLVEPRDRDVVLPPHVAKEGERIVLVREPLPRPTEFVRGRVVARPVAKHIPPFPEPSVTASATAATTAATGSRRRLCRRLGGWPAASALALFVAGRFGACQRAPTAFIEHAPEEGLPHDVAVGVLAANCGTPEGGAADVACRQEREDLVDHDRLQEVLHLCWAGEIR
mmetsp:Transcript_106132/g.307050  ORF Transcript_106132/g.307050 Transcript_106132/m.307050 type:complete len:201 (-) Transcript_106132:108-710(-)